MGSVVSFRVFKLEKKVISPRGIFEDTYVIDSDGVPRFKILIGGSWSFGSSGGDYFDVRSPIDGNTVARATRATKDDANSAVQAAYSARTKIRSIAAVHRIELFEKTCEVMRSYAEDFIRTIVIESGKPISSARGEFEASLLRMCYASEEARRIYGEYIPGDWVEDTKNKVGMVIREPVGVVAAISPFNYPLFSGVSKVVPAILAGNAVVLKPASDTPISLIMYARALEVAGLPSGVLNVVTGSGSDVGDVITRHELVGAISFTGSTEIGKQIAARAGLKRLHLELGGKAAAIVLEDADIDLAARKVAQGSLRNSGQRCDAISRVLVVEEVAEAFVKKLREEVARTKSGNPWDDDVVVGPLINERALRKVDELVRDALSRGAELVMGGSSEGLLYHPTILDKVPLDSRIAWEETFGPVIPVIRVKDLDEALEVANRSRYGLDSCVFTTSMYKAWRAIKLLEVGTVTVNDFPAHGVGNFPFGGIKDSGIGREGLGYSIDELTVLKTISINVEPSGLRKE